MKILQIFGAVVAVHLLAFIFIFASPGCQSGPHNVPTPDATLPGEASPAPVTFNANAVSQPVDLGTAPAGSYSRPSPTRPGSPAAVAVSPVRATEDVAPVTTYKIVKGDSLWSVAKKNHLPVAELAKFNNLSTGAALKPGSKLMIPVKPGAVAAPKDGLVSSTSAKPVAGAAEKSPGQSGGANEGAKYTVLPGESLGVIAHKHQVSVGELAAVNNITDPSKVRAGQQLIIPTSKVPGAARPAASSGPRSTATAKPTAPSSTAGAKAAAAPAPAAPRFEITAPPPGQDLDAGLKEATTEVPTIKVEEATGEQAAKK